MPLCSFIFNLYSYAANLPAFQRVLYVLLLSGLIVIFIALCYFT